MFCPSCGKQLSDEFAFCPHCGNALPEILPVVATDKPKPFAPVEWQYADFVYRWPGHDRPWHKISGPHGTSEMEARLDYWSENQREILFQLQQWIDMGWEPLGEVGAASIVLRTYRDAKIGGCSDLLILLIGMVATFGLVLLFIRETYVEPAEFRVQMRGPAGLQIPRESSEPQEMLVLCPHCGEMTHSDKDWCVHCLSYIEEKGTHSQQSSQIRCPHCGEMTYLDRDWCVHCLSYIDVKS